MGTGDPAKARGTAGLRLQCALRRVGKMGGAWRGFWALNSRSTNTRYRGMRPEGPGGLGSPGARMPANAHAGRGAAWGPNRPAG